MMRAVSIPLACAIALAPMPGAALTPLPPCEQVEESNMRVSDVMELARTHKGAVTLERYSDPFDLQDDGVYRHRNASIPALHDFNGVRVVDCASGRMLAIDGEMHTDTVFAALTATEFLRGHIQQEREVSFSKVRRAVQAVYPDRVIELRETETTCGCAWFEEAAT